MAVINEYELVYIINAGIGEEATTAITEKFKKLITENGEVVSVDEWGKRRLAYPINDENEGYYVQVNFKSGNSLPAEIERQLKITDGVMRNLIIKKDPKQEAKKHFKRAPAPSAKAQPEAPAPAAKAPAAKPQPEATAPAAEKTEAAAPAEN